MTARPNIILASQSMRRRMLLQEAGVEFRVDVSDAPEPRVEGETPEAMVRRLALVKAATVAARHDAACVVIGADTVVVIDGMILGKPATLEDAAATLRRLSGREHRVLTGVALVRGAKGDVAAAGSAGESPVVFSVETRVRFKALDSTAIQWYISHVDVLDKAGAYAIQEHGDTLVESIDGSRSNVIGLPVEETLAALCKIRPLD